MLAFGHGLTVFWEYLEPPVSFIYGLSECAQRDSFRTVLPRSIVSKFFLILGVPEMQRLDGSFSSRKLG